MLTPSLPVNGQKVLTPTGLLLVLDGRLEGHNSFLTGTLAVNGLEIPVRITTLDDITALQPTQNLASVPERLSERWAGTLHLRHSQRPRTIPDDLNAAAGGAARNLNALDDAELRYALTFLGEATTAPIRAARLNAIVHALPTCGGESQ